MEVLERDVTCSIGRVPFTFADVRDALCDVGNDGRLNIDGLGVEWREFQCIREESKKHHIGIAECFVPMSQTSAHESSSSEEMMVRILRLVYFGGQ